MLESEDLYRTLAKNFPNGGVFLFERDLRYCIAEGAGLAAIGVAKELLEGKTIWQVWSRQICQIIEPYYRAALAGETNAFEVQYDNRVFSLHTLPVKNDKGEILAGMVMSQEITSRKQAEIALRESEQRLRRQTQILMKLARRKTLNQRDLNAAIREITEAAAETLEIERVSVWLYNNFKLHISEDAKLKLVCIDLYERSANRHSQGFEISADTYPSYFQALETDRTIAAHDAHTDPRTKEFSQNYLTRLGLRSMLDAPIWLEGQMVGVVCHEQVEPGRQWALEEENFAGSIADLVSLAIEAHERQRTEAALRESEEKFSKAFRSSPSAIAIASFPEGRLIDINDNFSSISGYDREEVIGRTALELNFWVNLEDRLRSIQMLQNQGAIRNFEFQFRKKSGEIVVGLYSAERIVLGGQECILLVVTDISDRIRDREQIKITAERDRLLAQIALRIRRSLNLDQILNTTVAEVRQFLHADRVYIYQGTPTGIAKVVAESVDFQWPSIRGWRSENATEIAATALFDENCIRVIDDTFSIKLPQFIAEFYQQYHIKAGLVVPIMLGDEAFGVLAAHQCSAPRHWRSFEIDLLKQLATQVAIAIQQAELYQQVQALNTNLESQVQERTAQLEQKMQELQELNQIKDLFLHGVTHDLRTPVMGWLMVLKNLLANGNEQLAIPVSRSILERMVQSSDRQLHLINSLLELHSSEIHGIVLHREPVQLSQLIASILAELEPLLAKNQATLTNLVPNNIPIINAYPNQLWRVFENLIANALNHNPPGLCLTLSATVETEPNSPITNSLIRITLQDNGVGMSQETCDHLFEIYVRGSHNRRSTSIGLGLYLCRQIIIAHGGEIGVKSSPGAGATFWFTLPAI
ncbi:GAF domain-containing protein [Microseira sp. BLCC-F43]|jgi:PAS domain S-box-containing protein|uniref:sensor histidine kinase n=1 Tax=Microseira sp. BLCC-F43 TaxID=3153602 RepID=UPI0035B6F9FD